MLRVLIGLSLVLGGCTWLLPKPEATEYRCLDLSESDCREAWAAVKDEHPLYAGRIEDAVVGRGGGAAECHPDPCQELVVVTVTYDTDDELLVTLVEGPSGHLEIEQTTMRISN